MIVLALIVAALATSGFFSGAETALLSVSRVRVRHRMETGDPNAAIVWTYLKDPEALFTSILLAVNVCNVAASALATAWFASRGYRAADALATAVMTVVILLVAELIPKAVGRRLSEGYALRAARLLDLTRLTLAPVVWLVELATRFLMRVIGVPAAGREQFVTREEIQTFLEGQGEGVPAQRQMIRGAWTFARASVREVMIPLTRVRALPVGAKVGEALALGREHGLARLPIFRERIDDLVAVLDLGELVFRSDVDPEAPVEDWARKPLYLPNTLGTEKAILALQKARETMAVVVDEYGGCDGVVVMKDMFEEVVGDLEGPLGRGPEIHALGPRLFLASGQVDLDTVNDELALELPKRGYETLAGFLMTAGEAVPEAGQKVSTPRATFEVLEVRQRTATRVRIRLH